MAEIQPFEDAQGDLFSTMFRSKQRTSVKSLSDTNQDMDNSKAGIKEGEIPKLLAAKLKVDTINESKPSGRRHITFRNPFYDIILIESFKAHNCQMCFNKYDDDEEEEGITITKKCCSFNKCSIV